MAFKFLLTTAQLFYALNKTEGLKTEQEEIYHDNYDFYTELTLKYRKAIINIYSGYIYESINMLYYLIDYVSLHHFFHFEIEIKLTLAYLHIKQNEFEKANKVLKMINRKVNDGQKVNYPNALQFIKILSALIDKNKSLNKDIVAKKIQGAIQQFNFLNTGERKILSFLQPEIESIIKGGKVSYSI